MLNPVTNKLASAVFIKSGQSWHRVNVADITWIGSEGNYVTVHTSHKRYVLKMPLKKINTFLSPETFLRIHRSFIVQLALINRIDTIAGEVQIGDIVLPLGRSYKDQLMSQLHLLE